jgi:DNA ligase-1
MVKKKDDVSDPKQATLHSFFGLPNKKQTSMKSFVKPKGDKENATATTSKKRTSPSSASFKNTELDKRRRHAIMDDSDDEEMETPVSKASTFSPVVPPDDESEEMQAKMAVPDNDNAEEEKEELGKEEAAPCPSPSLSIKPSATCDINDNAAARLIQQAKKLSKAAKVEVDVEELSSPVPYQELAKTLEKIEATSKRLEIQSILTKLLRRILQHCPQDLHSVIYLASNSLAPAYECIELGIGDSLLIDAIAQAYGTNKSKCKV